MCAPTGGLVENAPAEKLDEAVADALLQKTIASQIKVKVRINNRFKFRHEDDENLSQGKSVLERRLGNAFEPEVSFTFEYELKSLAELATLKVPSLMDLKDCAIQLEISYSGLDGSKHLRVITHVLPISNDKQKCDSAADEEILRANAVQQAGKLARSGDVEKAQAFCVGWGKNFKSKKSKDPNSQQYKKFKDEFSDIYSQLKQTKLEQKNAQSVPMRMMRQQIGGGGGSSMPMKKMKMSDQLSS